MDVALREDASRIRKGNAPCIIVVCAVISGGEGWEQIANFGHSQLNWLRRFIPLTNGAPSHGRYRRIGMIKP